MYRFVLLAGLALAALPSAARAAESYDNCAGTISSLPATITTAGVWCMKSDLATSMSSGQAIWVKANNVTIDCNDFRLGGLAGGMGTAAIGIMADGRVNLTVRHCNVRGFLYGVYAQGEGHVVEDSRFDGSTHAGVYMTGDRYIVRRNFITQIGGSTSHTDYYGILGFGSSGLIEHNAVHGVVGNGQTYSSAAGIGVASNYTVIRQNDVSGIFSGAEASVIGIYSGGTGNKLLGNTVAALNTSTGQRRGLSCTGDPTGVAIGNVISQASSGAAVTACIDGGGNVTH